MVALAVGSLGLAAGLSRSLFAVVAAAWASALLAALAMTQAGLEPGQSASILALSIVVLNLALVTGLFAAARFGRAP